MSIRRRAHLEDSGVGWDTAASWTMLFGTGFKPNMDADRAILGFKLYAQRMVRTSTIAKPYAILRSVIFLPSGAPPLDHQDPFALQISTFGRLRRNRRRPGTRPLLCRFSDAGNAEASYKLVRRRRKSAKGRT